MRENIGSGIKETQRFQMFRERQRERERRRMVFNSYTLIEENSEQSVVNRWPAGLFANRASLRRFRFNGSERGVVGDRLSRSTNVPTRYIPKLGDVYLAGSRPGWKLAEQDGKFPRNNCLEFLNKHRTAFYCAERCASDDYL